MVWWDTVIINVISSKRHKTTTQRWRKTTEKHRSARKNLKTTHRHKQLWWAEGHTNQPKKDTKWLWLKTDRENVKEACSLKIHPNLQSVFNLLKLLTDGNEIESDQKGWFRMNKVCLDYISYGKSGAGIKFHWFVFPQTWHHWWVILQTHSSSVWVTLVHLLIVSLVLFSLQLCKTTQEEGGTFLYSHAEGNRWSWYQWGRNKDKTLYLDIKVKRSH